jgi:hypothetical protein
VAVHGYIKAHVSGGWCCIKASYFSVWYTTTANKIYMIKNQAEHQNRIYPLHSILIRYTVGQTAKLYILTHNWTRFTLSHSNNCFMYWCQYSQPVHRTATYRCDDTRRCIIQFFPPDDEHMVLETCRGLK